MISDKDKEKLGLYLDEDKLKGIKPMADRKLPPLIEIVQYHTCEDNHLHMIFMDKDKTK